jgi:hypothetical protein
MGIGTEFVAQLEVVMGRTVGRIAGKGLPENQVTKLNEDRGALSADDCKILIQNIIQSISLFVTEKEAARAQSARDKLFKTHFS